MSGTGNLVTRVYGGFRGVDFRGEGINIVRSPDSLNVWKDYKHTDSIRTRPGMELYMAFTEPIYGIYFYKGKMIAHSGNTLYTVAGGVKRAIYSGVAAAESNAFVYEDVWYFKDGKNYLQYDGNVISSVVGYVPTTSMTRAPSGDGKVWEDVNMLTGWRINTFRGDGGSTEFYLDATDLDTDKLPEVTVNGARVTNGFVVDYAKGKISIAIAPDAPKTDGQDNVSVKFCKTVEGYRDAILKCKMLQVFDNRVFFSGNEELPNVVWHCGLNDPTYVSDTDYYREGMDNAQVKGMVAGNNALWVFREPSGANTNVFYHTPSIDEEYGKVYPSSHSSVTIGCVGKAINFNDDIVFFSDRGMEGISGDVTTEQMAAHRSSLVDRLLTAEKDYRNMILEEWAGYLFVFVGDKAYLADSRGVFTNQNHIEYEWFYWQMEKPVTSARVQDGVLYLGTADGVYTLTDNTCPLECWWTTPKDKFNYPQMQKTTNKRGCVAEATGDVTVYAKTENTDFERIGDYNDVADYFVSRIKRKKFKDIQLKFHSHTRFSLETVTLECWVGGYIKR